jgi:predicted MPP superfamily phosphohydrolase
MGFVVRTAELPILPEGHRSIRVLHFSDLHLTPKRKREVRDIQSFINLQPDMVISTGDFLGHMQAVPTVLRAVDDLLDLPGVFVFGSNDYYAPKPKNPFSYLFPDDGKRNLGKQLPFEDLSHGLSRRGWLNLNHQKTSFTIKDTKIELRGTDDAHLNRDDYSLVAGEVDPSAHISIGVTHAPYKRLLQAMEADRLNAIFAGHTHGGQVRLPWIGGSRALVTNCDLPTWRARGLTKFGHEPWLNISAGMGTSPFARIRIASPPEVSLITLTSG